MGQGYRDHSGWGGMPQDLSADGADLQTLVAAEALEMEIHPPVIRHFLGLIGLLLAPYCVKITLICKGD